MGQPKGKERLSQTKGENRKGDRQRRCTKGRGQRLATKAVPTGVQRHPNGAIPPWGKSSMGAFPRGDRDEWGQSNGAPQHPRVMLWSVAFPANEVLHIAQYGKAGSKFLLHLRPPLYPSNLDEMWYPHISSKLEGNTCFCHTCWIPS